MCRLLPSIYLTALLISGVLFISVASALGGGGVHALSLSEALAAGFQVTFSPGPSGTGRATAESRYRGALETSSLRDHLPAIRQLAGLVASVRVVGARDSGTLWAVLCGLSEARESPGEASSSSSSSSGNSMRPVHFTPWEASPRDPELNPALLSPLGASLGLSVRIHPPALTPPPQPLSSSELLILDGSRCYQGLARDLHALAPYTARFIAIPSTQAAGLVSEAVLGGHSPLEKAREWGVELNVPGERGGFGGPEAHLGAAAGLKAAIFDFLAQNLEWRLSSHFPNAGGFTILAKQ